MLSPEHLMQIFREMEEHRDEFLRRASLASLKAEKPRTTPEEWNLKIEIKKKAQLKAYSKQRKKSK